MSTLSAQVLRLLDRANTWTAAQSFSAGSPPQIAEGTITHAQILLLRSSFITALPAPTANKIHVVKYCRVVVDTSHGAYGNIITAGGTDAWFGFYIGTRPYLSLFDDTTLGANVTAGIPLPTNVLPGYNPAGFTETFGGAAVRIVELETKNYRDYSNSWGFVVYGAPTAGAAAGALQFRMGHSGAVGELTGGGSGNSISWHIEYDTITLS